MQWDAVRYGNVTTTVIPANEIWIPPLMLASRLYETFILSLLPPRLPSICCVVRVIEMLWTQWAQNNFVGRVKHFNETVVNITICILLTTICVTLYVCTPVSICLSVCPLWVYNSRTESY